MIAIAAVILQLGGPASVRAQEGAATPAAATEEAEVRIPPDELDSLVAPVALYSDPLLAQVLVASTYPLEIIQLQQWLGKNPGLEGDALAEAVATQPWDPSIQSMAALPDLVTRLADDIQWVTDLGNAFLTNQADVMDAVQRMRAKAKDKGALETNEQQVVSTEVVETDDGHRGSTRRPGDHLRAVLQPDLRLPAAGLPLPAGLLPALQPRRRVRRVQRRCHVGRGDLGRLMLPLRLGTQQRQHQRQQQLQSEQQRQRQRRQLAAQFSAPRRNAVREQGDGEQVRRIGARRLDEQPPGDRPSAGLCRQSIGGRQRRHRQPCRRECRQPTGRRQREYRESFAGSTGSRPSGASPSASNRSGSGAGPSTTNRAGGGGPSASTNNIGSRNIPSSSGAKAGGFGGSSAGYSGSNARAASSRGASSMASRGGGGGGRRR